MMTEKGIVNMEDNYGNLRWPDLMYALEFYHSNKNGIVVQCPTIKDIPYIKRTVMSQLGEPDKMLGNDLYYRDQASGNYKYIKIRPILHASIELLRGYHEDELFYIGWSYEQDIIEMVKEGVEIDRYPSILGIWKSIGVDAFSAFNKLTAMGYLEDEARNLVSFRY